MLRKTHALRLGILSLFALASQLNAGNFAIPAERPLPFRRDKIPLDREQLVELSEHLTTLAENLDGETAENRRIAAQTLALALAVDPANTSARELLFKYEDQKHTPKVKDRSAQNAFSRVQENANWLKSPAAGGDANALAVCFEDILPQHNIAIEGGRVLSSSNQKGNWNGWIPGIVAYQNTIAATSKAQSFAKKTTPFLLRKAEIHTTLWQRTDSSSDKWVLGKVPVRMTAYIQRPTGGFTTGQKFSLVIGPHGMSGEFPELTRDLQAELTDQYKILPEHGRVKIDSPALEDSPPDSKLQPLSAAAVILARAAFSGIEPDATIIGLVGPNDAFSLPPNFWQHLMALNGKPGGRLILPTAAAEYLPSLIALEKSHVFFQYEVILADTIGDVITKSAKRPDSALAQNSKSFKEISEKLGSQPLGSYLSNRFVRDRLGDIASSDPTHYSAKMLLLYGTDIHPTTVPRKILNEEILKSLAPMEWLVLPSSAAVLNDRSVNIAATFEICRNNLLRLRRYAAISERPLLDSIQLMVLKVQPLDRAVRGRSDITEVRAHHSALMRSYRKVVQEIDRTEPYTEVASDG